MHKRIFHSKFKSSFSKTPDGLIKDLPIDQFAVRDFNINIFGFPKSDLTLLVELTCKQEFDVSRYNEFAQRIHMLHAEPKNNKSIEQLIHEWRPAWIQTVSEEQQFAEYYYNEFDKPNEDKSNVDKLSEDVKPNVEVANE